MILLRLAVRNLLRNTRRTLLSLASVVAGVAVLVIGPGFVGGFEENIIRAQIDTLSGHAILRPLAYPTEGLQHPVDNLIVVDAALTSALDATTEAWTPRTFFAPRVVHAGDAMRVRAIGFDPARDTDVFPRDTWKVNGKIPTTVEDGVLVGAGLARLLDLEPGERLVLQARTPEGAINALDVAVSGVVSVGSPLIDRGAMLVPSPLVELLLRSEGHASHIAVRLRSRDAAFSWADEIRARGLPANAEAVTWYDEVKALLELQAIRRKALDILALALMGMSAAGIMNTVLMAAYERIREVGTLRALGMTEGRVMVLFLTEGALMGATGALVGGALGGGLVWWYSVHGIDLADMLTAGGNIPVSAMLYTEFDPLGLVRSMAFGVVVAVLASVWPARVASRMVPADAVRA